MKHIWSVLCKNSIINRETNSLTLVDCIEQVNVSLKKDTTKDRQMFFIPMNFELVSLYYDEKINKERKVEIYLELQDATKKKLKDFTMNFTMPKMARRLRNRIKIDSLPVTSEGLYLFKMKFREKGKKKYQVIDVPLDVFVKHQ